MKKIISTLVIGTFAFLSSCSSDDNKNNPTPPTTVQAGCKLTRITSPRPSGPPYMEVIFTYNGNKMAGFLLSYGGGVSRYELVYENSNSDRIKEIEVFENEKLTSLGRYVLEYNNNGQIIKIQTVFGNNLPVGEFIYTYEGNKRTQERHYFLNELEATYNYEWQDDNCVKMSYVDPDGNQYNWNSSLQYSTATNTMPKLGLELLDIVDADYSVYLSMYGSKNLVNKEIYSYNSSYPINYTYTFTQKGLVENVYANGTLEYKFEYSCEE